MGILILKSLAAWCGAAGSIDGGGEIITKGKRGRNKRMASKRPGVSKTYRHDVEIYKISSDAARFKENRLLLYRLAKLTLFGYLGYLFKTGFDGLVLHSPEQLNGLANIIKSAALTININVKIPWILVVFCILAIFFLMRRVRRLTKKYAECRKKLEAQDPDRSSSGLTEYGETPRRR